MGCEPPTSLSSYACRKPAITCGRANNSVTDRLCGMDEASYETSHPIGWLVSDDFNSGRSLTVAVRIAYLTAPSILAFLPPSRSLVRVTQTWVVSIRAAIEAAFESALITTFAGSMMPALNMSTYSPVLAL